MCLLYLCCSFHQHIGFGSPISRMCRSYRQSDTCLCCSRNVILWRTTCGCRRVSHLILQWGMQRVMKWWTPSPLWNGSSLDTQTWKDAVPKSEHSWWIETASMPTTVCCSLQITKVKWTINVPLTMSIKCYNCTLATHTRSVTDAGWPTAPLAHYIPPMFYDPA